MKIRTLLLPALYLATVILSHNLPAQDLFSPISQDETTQVTADSVVLQPFPSLEITEEFGNTNTLITKSGEKHLTREAALAFYSETDTLESQISKFLLDSSIHALEDLRSRELDQISLRAQFFTDHIETLQDRLSKVSTEIESALALLQDNGQRWQLTLEQGTDDPAFESRVERIERTIQEIDSVRQVLQDDLGVTLEMQDKLADKLTELEGLISRVRDQKLLLGETLLNRDMPGFFKDLPKLRDSKLTRSHMQEFKKSIEADLELLKSSYTRPMVFATLMMLLLLAFSIWVKRNRTQYISKEYSDLSKLHLTIVNSPVVYTFFVMALMIRLLVPDLPQTFFGLNILIMLVAMVILMIRIYGAVFRTWIIVLVMATSINVLYELSYQPGILLRILLMGLSLTGLWLFTWLYRKRPFYDLIKHKLVYRLVRVLIVGFSVMQILAIIGNLVGTFRLAEFFTLIPLQITVLAIAIQLSTKLADTILYMDLSSNYFQKLNVVREEFQVIYKKGLWLMDFILLFVFISIALGIVGIKDLVFAWGRGVLSDGIKIGAIDISLGSILIFFFVIWISIMLSRIISNILEKDVFSRVKTAKGIPGTVTLLLKIALISGGFFLAAAASGMHLTNLSIVLGAFSVGIGFGLQNIFNNLVSGLILAFERPINVGDVIQVGELVGTVQNIGLRSSTIKSFDGAEVIVPNGNLISNEMINWTLSDSNRRMDIKMGVAYGTDPERVLAIMEEIAQTHEYVWQDPAPKGYFIDFGDSSLNFRLLAWVDLDNRLRVESELRVQINKKLAEAGIEIPFPQHDLHIRSDATKKTGG